MMNAVKELSMFRRQHQTPTIHLSFQPPAIAVVRWVQWTLAVITLASLGFVVVLLQESRSLDEQSEYYEHALARQHRVTQLLTEDMAHAGLTLTNEQVNAARQEIAFANQLTEKQDFSWTEMLHDLEKGIPSSISINSVRLNFQDSTIQLHGAVRTMQDLDALVTKLNQTGTFSRVGLTQHSIRQSMEAVTMAQSNQRSTDVIDFALVVTYHQPL
jgi:hypothetical protein